MKEQTTGMNCYETDMRCIKLKNLMPWAREREAENRWCLLKKIQMVSVEEDDFAGLEDVSYDDNYEANLADGELVSTGALVMRRPSRKKSRVDKFEALPLMEGEGKSFRELGFNQSQGLHLSKF